PLPRLHQPAPTLFPYTTLFRSLFAQGVGLVQDHPQDVVPFRVDSARLLEITRCRSEISVARLHQAEIFHHRSVVGAQSKLPGKRDRKSTRLNSSHLGISYAVFC